MTTDRSALDVFLEMQAAMRALGLGCCEMCGAGMTAVEIPGDKLRAWMDHTPECPDADNFGVFILDAASVRAQPIRSNGELKALWAQAGAAVQAEND
jgi:hypothetical protein